MPGKVTRERRTQTQAVLYLVSLVMIVLGAIDVVFGAAVALSDPAASGPRGHEDLVLTGVAIIAAGALVLATGALGYVASKDYSHAGRYRFLCYLVSLCILLVIAYGWSNGKNLIFDPLVLGATIIYVLVCSTLADQVEKEYALGVRGHLIVRDARQRALHFLSAIIALEGTLFLLVAGTSVALSLMGLDAFGLPGSDAADIPLLVGDARIPGGATLRLAADAPLRLAATGAVDLAMGLAGFAGSNHPRHVLPFLVASSLALAVQATTFAVLALRSGPLSSGAPEALVSMLFFSVCTYLAAGIRRQARTENESRETGRREKESR